MFCEDPTQDMQRINKKMSNIIFNQSSKSFLAVNLEMSMK